MKEKIEWFGWCKELEKDDLEDAESLHLEECLVEVSDKKHGSDLRERREKEREMNSEKR